MGGTVKNMFLNAFFPDKFTYIIWISNNLDLNFGHYTKMYILLRSKVSKKFDARWQREYGIGTCCKVTTKPSFITELRITNIKKI